MKHKIEWLCTVENTSWKRKDEGAELENNSGTLLNGKGDNFKGEMLKLEMSQFKNDLVAEKHSLKKE
jgi:hypothetical protein